MFTAKMKLEELHAISNIIVDHNLGPMGFMVLPLDFDKKLEQNSIKSFLINSHVMYDAREVPTKIKVSSVCGEPNHDDVYLIGIFSLVNAKLEESAFLKSFASIVSHLESRAITFEYLDISYLVNGENINLEADKTGLEDAEVNDDHGVSSSIDDEPEHQEENKTGGEEDAT